jgi:hypothetical protein
VTGTSIGSTTVPSVATIVDITVVPEVQGTATTSGAAVRIRPADGAIDTTTTASASAVGVFNPTTDETTGTAAVVAIAFKVFFFDPALYTRGHTRAVQQDPPRTVYVRNDKSRVIYIQQDSSRATVTMIDKPRIVYIQQDKPRKVAV